MTTFNFLIQADERLSTKVRNLGIQQFSDLIELVQKIPYGRTSNRSKVELVLDENRGTCSSKHALLKQLAKENGAEDLLLVIGIYRMKRSNTPGIGDEIEKNQLHYIPEAHCYLKWGQERIDITSEDADFDRIEKDLLLEQEIEPEQIGQYKVELHQNYIKKWIKEEAIAYSFEKVWQIREECIKRLSVS